MWIFKIFFLVSLVFLVSAQPQQQPTSKPTVPTRPKVTSPPATLPPQGFGLRLANALSWTTSCQDFFREEEYVYQATSTFNFTLTSFTNEMSYQLYPDPEALCEEIDMKVFQEGTYTMTGSGYPGEVQSIVFNGTRTIAELYNDKAVHWFNVECSTSNIRDHVVKPNTNSTNATTTSPTTTPSTTPATTTATPTSANSTVASTTTPTEEEPFDFPITVELTSLPCGRVPGTSRCKIYRQIIKGTLGGDGFFLGKRGVGWSCERVPTELATALWRATFPDTTVVPLSVLNSSSQISPSLVVTVASLALFLLQLFV